MNKEHMLLTAEQMRQADANAIQRLGHGYGLMQQAGKKVFEQVTQHINTEHYPPKVLILCGMGNNGGDGFVAARHFLEEKITADVVLLGEISNMRETASKAFEELPRECLIEAEAVDWNDYSIIIDALFGIGLDRNITGSFAEVIEAANQTDALRIAIDIPSGVDTDSGKILGRAFQADLTITFFAAKLGHYLLPSKAYCGEVVVTDIGIEMQDLAEDSITYRLNHPDCWQHKLTTHKLDQHKYHRGHSIIIGAEMDGVGASKLAALAALRAGSGLVSIACSEETLPIYASWATAIMTKPYANEEELENILQYPKVSAIAHGMGARVKDSTRDRVIAILKTGKPCVLDADAISAFKGELKTLQPHLHDKVVLTPHEGEFWRLFSGHISANEGRLQMALQAASLTGAVILLKGNDTLIAAPDGQAYINNTAPIHLATAGSGDVLAGIITGQLALGIPPFEAAASGVWMHSQSANRYRKGMVADDIIEGILEEQSSNELKAINA